MQRVSPRWQWTIMALVAMGAVVAIVLARSPSTPTPPTVSTPSARSTPTTTPKPSGGVPVRGFARLPEFARNSVWSTRVDGASTTVDRSSDLLVGRLNELVDKEIAAHNGPWINTTQYSVPVYSVSKTQAKVPVTLDRSQPYAATLKASFAAGVPLPENAESAAGLDKHLVVWQPSTDTMWEFWHMRRNSDGWHADWGGTMTDVSKNPGYFNGKFGSGVNEAQWGATAASLPLVTGLITPAELQAGKIDHALSLALPEARAKTWSTPAQRTDGFSLRPESIPEGARFRVDPKLDLDALDLPPLALILARAAQKYGIIIRDKAGVVTFYAQDPAPTGAANPYPALFRREMPSKALASFPWKHLQVVSMNLRGFSGR